MRIAMIDNYDSFTYNLVHYMEAEYGIDVEVMRNDELDFDYLHLFDRIVISPGPGLPSEAGRIKELIENCHKSKAILGICLGQQAIGEVFGAKLKNLNSVLHGVATKCYIDTNSPIFHGCEKEIQIGRYHSWVIDPVTLSNEFSIIGKDEEGEIMAIQHKEYNLIGLQFHPESILTPNGFQIIQNWLKLE